MQRADIVNTVRDILPLRTKTEPAPRARYGNMKKFYEFFLKRNCDGVMPTDFLKVCMKCFSWR